MGGAQAVAALAFGTETVPQVDKITGPGQYLGGNGETRSIWVLRHRHDRRPGEVLIMSGRRREHERLSRGTCSRRPSTTRWRRQYWYDSSQLGKQ